MDALLFDPAAARDETCPPVKTRFIGDVYISDRWPNLFINVWRKSSQWLLHSYKQTPGNLRRARRIQAALEARRPVPIPLAVLDPDGPEPTESQLEAVRLDRWADEISDFRTAQKYGECL